MIIIVSRTAPRRKKRTSVSRDNRFAPLPLRNSITQVPRSNLFTKPESVCVSHFRAHAARATRTYRYMILTDDSSRKHCARQYVMLTTPTARFPQAPSIDRRFHPTSARAPADSIRVLAGERARAHAIPAILLHFRGVVTAMSVRTKRQWSRAPFLRAKGSPPSLPPPTPL